MQRPVGWGSSFDHDARKGSDTMGTMSGTRNMCSEQADATAASLDEIWEAIDADTFTSDGEDGYEALQERPLEVVWEKGEPFAVVLGTGGPHVEIRGGGWHDGRGYTLHVYWAGEHVTRHGSESSGIARTGRYFRESLEAEGE